MLPVSSEKYSKSCFPFVNLLIVVRALKNHVVLVLGAKYEAPCQVDAYTRADMSELVGAIGFLYQCGVGVRVDNAGTHA